MAEELQNLLDRIQKEGVERADAEAERIVSEAKARAKALVAEAERESAARIEKARTESDLFTRRSENAIAQAARDLIISVGDAITETLQAIVARDVDWAMRAENLPGFIQAAISAYGSAENAANLEVILSDRQKDDVTAFLMKELAVAMKNGLTIRSSRNIISGFRVALKDTGVQHDFTGEALTGAIGELLRPQLAEIVRNALAKTESAAAR